MEVTILLLENIDQAIQEEIKKLIPSEEELEEKRIQKLIGNFDENEDSELKGISINVAKYYKEAKLFFDINKTDAMFLSSLEWKNKPIMVIVLTGKEYSCVYEETKYEILKHHLNKN